MSTQGMNAPTSDGYRSDWATPQPLVDSVAHMLGCEWFDMDVCALDATKKAPSYYGPDHIEPVSRDALKRPWYGVCWCNPPFPSPVASQFVRKALEEADENVMTAILLPVTKLEQPFAIELLQHRHLAAMIYIEGRIAFEADGKPVGGNRCGSMIWIIQRRPVPAAPAIGVIKRFDGCYVPRWIRG